jgi:DNA repair exonuclease SbcCD nuclease subunit
MRVLIFSDTHMHAYQEFSTLVEGVNSRLIEQVDCLDRIIQDVQDYQVDVVLFGGDMFHLKNYVPSDVLKLTLQRFRRLAELKPLIICPGNHDFRSWGRDPILLEVLQDFVDKVQMGPVVEFRDWKVCVFPYSRDIQALNTQIFQFQKDGPTIGLFHQDIVGQMYGKFLVEKGLDSKVLSNLFDFSFVGHFHNQKQIEPNVWSVGSPLMLNFSEAEHEKGWLILDTDTKEVLSLQNEDSPKFRIVTLKAEDASTHLQSMFGLASLQKDFFRIEILGPKQPDLSTIKWKRVKLEASAGKRKRTDLSFSDSNVAIIEKYVAARHGSLDEKALIEVGMRYLS